jgi:hypothetical protein
MIHPVPKPPRRVKPKNGLKRTPMKKGKPGASRFPKMRNPAYRAFIRAHDCTIMAWLVGARMSTHDVRTAYSGWLGRGKPTPWQHRCWGPIDPAHVGQHQANGAPDVGACVPLCRAAHSFYDEHRGAWAKATGLTEPKMANLAAGLALKYHEQGGTT